MALTDIKRHSAKPQKKQYMLIDGVCFGDARTLMGPNMGGYYRFGDKEKMLVLVLVLGKYYKVSQADTRVWRSG